MAKALPKTLPNSSSGLELLESGQRYISQWPTGRRPVDMKSTEKQSMAEAARWVEKA